MLALGSSRRRILAVLAVTAALFATVGSAYCASTMKKYYGHDAVADKYGVIAPWYKGLNGQCDYRVRIAAETLKRYPWADTKAAAAAPEFVWNGSWSISPEGVITVGGQGAWADGDRLQRDSFVIRSLADYYRYTGDAAALGLIKVTADVIVDHCQTDSKHPWPNFPITVPVKGKEYGHCDPTGMIQLDIAAEAGIGLIRAYQMTGEKRYLDTAKHWADLLAERRNHSPRAMPWQRYANPENSPWGQNPITGNVTYILYFMDELIRLGYTGENNAIVQARDAGRVYFRDRVLPQWLTVDAWGRNFWDWPCPVMCEYSTNWGVRYVMDNKEFFPDWKNDARNVLALYINRTGVDLSSNSEAYNGAWQFPESPGCCGRSLWYGSMELAWPYSQYAVEANSSWAREVARRMQTMATYDIHETGVSEDNIDGGFIVANGWFKIAHPMALMHVLGTIAWMPEEFGASRENHIVRSTATVSDAIYGDGRVSYSTFDAPKNTTDVLRLSFAPKAVTGDGKALESRKNLRGNGYTVRKLSNGDCIVSVRHDGSKAVVITGEDPQVAADDAAFVCTGSRSDVARPGSFGGTVKKSSESGAAFSYDFSGNQVRLIGSLGPDGGKADVYVDGVKQIVGIDCWCPYERNQQVIYYKNGLDNGKHTLKVVVAAAKNLLSSGTNVYVDGIQWSASDGSTGFGEGGGPTDTQRFIFGYPERKDLVDSQGNKWRPGMEYLVRLGAVADVVGLTWWTSPVTAPIGNTKDSALYSYGVHGHGLICNVTVGPGKYYARLKFAATRGMNTDQNCITVIINGKRVVKNMDVALTAGGVNRAVDLVFNDLTPVNGLIAVQLLGGDVDMGGTGEAFIQALEVGRGSGGQGANPVGAKSCSGRINLLRNPGFEEGVASKRGTSGKVDLLNGWMCEFGGPGETYVVAESEARIKPNQPAARTHAGVEAIRIHTAANGKAIVYQDAQAKANTEYNAWVWVQTVAKTPEGFGAAASDSAGMYIEELDASGAVIKIHKKVAINKAQPYDKIDYTFKSDGKTVKLRFNLEGVILGTSRQGSVSFDDCVLTEAPQRSK